VFIELVTERDPGRSPLRRRLALVIIDGSRFYRISIGDPVTKPVTPRDQGPYRTAPVPERPDFRGWKPIVDWNATPYQAQKWLLTKDEANGASVRTGSGAVFTRVDASTWKDEKSGLIWRMPKEDAPMTFDEAALHCRQLGGSLPSRERLIDLQQKRGFEFFPQAYSQVWVSPAPELHPYAAYAYNRYTQALDRAYRGPRYRHMPPDLLRALCVK
jgi:hypothetical protein